MKTSVAAVLTVTVSVLLFAACAGVPGPAPEEAEPAQTGAEAQPDSAEAQESESADRKATSAEKTATAEDTTGPQPQSEAQAEEQPEPEPEPEPVVIHLRTRTTRTLANGVVDEFIRYAYDPDTHRRVSEQHFVPEERPTSRRTYTYDPDGSIRVVNYAEDGQVESTVLQTFDEEGRLTYEDQLDAEGDPAMSSAYRYEDDRLKEWQLIGRSGEVLSYSLYEYTDGRRSEVTNFDATGKAQERVEYEYDDRGLLVESRTVDAGDGTELGSERMSYNDQRRLIEKITTSPGLFRKSRYEYDSDGNLVRETILGRGDEVLYVIEHEYETVVAAEEGRS